MNSNLVQIATALTALIVLGGPGPLPAASGYANSWDVPASVRVTLATDKSQYSLGDKIQVRISYQNMSTQSLVIPPRISPVNDVLLKIEGSDGVALPQAADVPQRAGPISGHTILLDPGVTIVEKSSGGEFIPISDWGYRITKAGTYHITAVLLGPGTSSNVATVIVTP